MRGCAFILCIPVEGVCWNTSLQSAGTFKRMLWLMGGAVATSGGAAAYSSRAVSDHVTAGRFPHIAQRVGKGIN